MRCKNKLPRYIFIFVLLVCISGCNREKRTENHEKAPDTKMEQSLPDKEVKKEEENTKNEPQESEIIKNEKEAAKTIIADFNKEFQSKSGCAVLYDTKTNTYTYYNEDICRQRVSPCSTFKIISAVSGLHNQVISPENSVMKYNGRAYSIEEWKKDLDLAQAFQSSCVWYFRKIIDGIGKDRIKEELALLEYGNCDVSLWDGSGVNSFPELNGFWLDSSLKISPLEQVEVLRKLLEGKSPYTQEEIQALKHIMPADSTDDMQIYGKTGTSSVNGGWFAGFGEKADSTIYFAVYLDDKNKEKVNGAMAKEIVMELLK